jgi:hypothetical protein
VVLIGHAAHGMSPNMAQGATLAFEDALELAACLRDAGTVTDALAAFATPPCGPSDDRSSGPTTGPCCGPSRPEQGTSWPLGSSRQPLLALKD